MNEFIYGKEEMDYLCQKDGKMKEVIETLGMIHREVDEDLFTSVIHHIVGQQISTKAQKTIYQRMKDGLGVIDENTICEASDAYLQSFGLTFRKVSYMKDFALKVRNHEIDLDELYVKSDEEVIEILQSLKGIGRWTAEMILYSACRERMYLRMMIWQFKEGCAWFIIIVRLQNNCLRNIVEDFHHIVPLRAYIFGQYLVER